MSEKYEQFHQIEYENVEDHSQKLENTLFKIQILFADHILENDKKQTDFSEILDKIGCRIFRKLKDLFHIENSDLDRETYKQKEGEFLQKCSDEINQIYLDSKNNNYDIVGLILDYLQK